MSSFLQPRAWGRGAILLLMACLCLPNAMAQTSSRDLDTQAVDRLDALLQQTDDSQERQPLSFLYENILQDAVNFPKQQTATEFERRFKTSSPSFGNALEDANTLAAGSAAGQALNKSIQEQEERTMFGRNMRFLDVYLIGKYLSMFMNGDRGDSSYDVFLDVGDVQESLTGDPGTDGDTLPPRFSVGSTNVGRYLKGAAVTAVEISDADRNDRIKKLIDAGTVQFKENGFPVCSLPGVVQDGSVQGLDTDTKKAILGRLVDLDATKQTADKTQDNKQLLDAQPEDDVFLRFLKGETIQLPNGQACFETYCARIDFIKTVPRLAPGRLTRPLPLLVSLEGIQDVTRKLSNTPLETKYVGKSVFSYSFANLDLLGQNYKPSLNIEVRAVPIFQGYDARKSFNTDGFDALVANYASLLSGDLSRTTSTAINPDRLPGSQVITDAARTAYIEAQKAQYKSTMILRTIIYWNATYLKVVGDRTLQLGQQVGQMSSLLTDLASAAHKLNENAKTIYNR